jgi:hypothetical protein
MGEDTYFDEFQNICSMVLVVLQIMVLLLDLGYHVIMSKNKLVVEKTSVRTSRLSLQK